MSTALMKAEVDCGWETTLAATVGVGARVDATSPEANAGPSLHQVELREMLEKAAD
jgi:hypothetical protein